MIGAGAHPDLPPYVQRAREPRVDGARARWAGSRRARGARDRRLLAGRDRGDRGSSRRRTAVGARPAPRAEGGPRPRVPGRVPPRTRARRRPRLRNGLRLLTRPGRRAAVGSSSRGRGSRARLPLRSRRWHARLGPRSPLHLPRRLALRAGASPARNPGPDRGVQMLPARRARGDRPRRDLIARLRVPDRDDLPSSARRLSRRRGPDHVRRPRGGRLEDEQGQSCSKRSGRFRCSERGLLPDACSHSARACTGRM